VLPSGKGAYVVTVVVEVAITSPMEVQPVRPDSKPGFDRATGAPNAAALSEQKAQKTPDLANLFIG